MINEIFVSRWDPVTPLPLMTAAQKDNELERILAGFSRGEELDQAFEEGRLEGYDEGYDNGAEEGYKDGYIDGRTGKATR